MGPCYKRGMANEIKIRVLVYRPGQPSEVEQHGRDLEAQQALVGGWIQSVPLGDGIVLTCNEEGKLEGLEPNFALPGDIIVGTAFFCRVDKEGECTSLTERDIKRIRAKVGR
jgi:hypothetical protein